MTYVYEQLDEVFKICRHYANEAGDDPRDTYRVFNLSKCKQVNAPETVTRILHLYAKIYCLLNDLNSHNRTHVIEKKKCTLSFNRNINKKKFISEFI